MNRGPKYAEGDCFAVPLRNGGFGVGIVARSNPKGVFLGYFFGPKRSDIPSIEELASLVPGDAALVGRCGDLGIVDGSWQILGRVVGWRRAAWPMPVFVRREEITSRSYRVVYDDADPSKLTREEQVEPGAGEGDGGPQDGLMGAGFAEKVLTKLLG